jgi:exodeoxyribonuclease VII small subunit
MPAKKSGSFNFEQSLTELNKLVSKMEQGNLALEDSLKAFEQGVALVQECQKALQTAEQKVQILSQQGHETLQPFEPDNGTD